MKKISQLAISIPVIVLGTLTLSACSGSRVSEIEANHGNSVRDMVSAQINNPDTMLNVDTDAVDASDGDRLDAVLGTYREDVSRPADVNQDIVINVGSGGAQ